MSMKMLLQRLSVFPHGIAAKPLANLWTGSVTNTLVKHVANDSALSKRVKDEEG